MSVSHGKSFAKIQSGNKVKGQIKIEEKKSEEDLKVDSGFQLDKKIKCANEEVKLSFIHNKNEKKCKNCLNLLNLLDVCSAVLFTNKRIKGNFFCGNEKPKKV